MTKILRKIFSAIETKAGDDGTRTLVVIISTSTPDRSGDVMDMAGCDLTNFLKNPVVAQFHNYQKPAIATAPDIKVSGDKIMATVEFPPEGQNPEADVLYNMYKGGFMNAWSIGFIPGEWGATEQGGRNFTKWELLEFSAVLVPDNAEALTVLRSKGVTEEFITKGIEDSKVTEVEVEAKEILVDADAENDADDDYTEETKVSELTVAQLRDILAGDQSDDEERSEFDTTDDLKAIQDLEIKSGRAISAKHQQLLKDCMAMHQKCVQNIKTILSSVKPPENDNTDDGKSINSAFLKNLSDSLKKNDKEIGLALRLLKSVNQTEKTK